MKNKFFSVTIVFLLIILTLTSNVFASDVTCPVCENTLNLIYPEGVSSFYPKDDGSGKHVNNMFLVKMENDYYIIVTCSYDNVHNKEKLYINDNNLATKPSCYMFAYFKYNSSTSNWDYIGWNETMPSFIPNVIENATFLSTTSTIFDDSSCTSIFFRQPPQGITLTLVEETTKTKITEQIKTMIVGFLKYLIVLVISVIAFYKGWKFLSTQLRKS